MVLTVVRREPYPPPGSRPSTLAQLRDTLRTGMYVDQRKITRRRMRQWLGKQLVLSPDAEEELLQPEKHSSR
eukprot:11611085-Karenia_brevis.AAC.1